jgi:Leucine-rich repeat (LRR) protein
LNLSGNGIASTGNLTHLTKLEELNLSSNRIATLDGGLLPANLSVLRLNDNQLTSLQSFPPYLTKLNELYLQDNAITDIGENNNTTKFPELESLDLRNNRIRSVKTGLAGYAALADLWIQGNPCCLSQSYLLEIVQALPELRTLDSMTDTQLKAQMEALRTGVITQDALLATMARPMTPLSGRPGSASSSRLMTPRSADSSRPVTPDRGAPLFQKPSSRSGT